MKPPPPMLRAGGCTTARANPVATAASTALPPACIMSTPTSEAKACTLTTMACCARTGWVEAAAERAKTQAVKRIRISDLCGDRMPDLRRPETKRLLRLAERSRQSQILISGCGFLIVDFKLNRREPIESKRESVPPLIATGSDFSHSLGTDPNGNLDETMGRTAANPPN